MMLCGLCDPPVHVECATHREYLDRHYNRTHGHLAGTPDVIAGPGQDWHAAAIAEVRRLAATGLEFAMWQVFEVIGDPPNHRTANGQFATEIDHLQLAHVTRYGKSLRPDSKSSACAYWRGGPNPERKQQIA